MRITQLARAAGHPPDRRHPASGVDVVTGLIKANVPDPAGVRTPPAYRLPGHPRPAGRREADRAGRLPLVPCRWGRDKPLRIAEAAFVSEKEIREVVAMRIKQAQPSLP